MATDNTAHERPVGDVSLDSRPGTIPEAAAVIGLGKLGLPLAACIARAGYRVAGWDCNPQVRLALLAGRCPVQEPGLDDYLRVQSDRLTWPETAPEAIGPADLVFIIVPTPSKPDGDFDASAVESALQTVAACHDRPGRLVIVVSTVSPGTMERLSTAYPTLRLAYNPEFIALGSVIGDLLCPDMVLIGTADTLVAERLRAFYGRFLVNIPPIRCMSFINAELTKLCINAALVAKMAYGTQVAMLCEVIPAADATVVLEAVGCDSRIGRACLRAGTPPGGPCLPRDGRALRKAGADHGVGQPLSETADALHVDWRYHILSKVGEASRIAILGLAYKPGTAVTEESFGVWLANRLLRTACRLGEPVGGIVRVYGYDPLVPVTAKLDPWGAIVRTPSAIECIRDADCVVVTTDCQQFRDELPPEAFCQPEGRKRLIDCWGVFDSPEYHAVTDYHRLGRHVCTDS